MQPRGTTRLVIPMGQAVLAAFGPIADTTRPQCAFARCEIVRVCRAQVSSTKARTIGTSTSVLLLWSSSRTAKKASPRLPQ